MKSFFKKENGAATILEATIVYPLVIIVLVGLIYFGLYTIQSTILYSRAQQAALIVSRMIAFPGYDDLNADISKTDFTEIPGQNEIEAAINGYSILNDAYRYWGGKVLNDNDAGKIEEQYNLLAKGSVFLAGNVDCNITVKNNIISQNVIVTIKGSPDYPKFFDLIGIGEVLKYDFSVKAVVNDGGEFVRNTDIVFDFTDYLLEKFHIKDQFGKYFSRIKTCIDSVFK